MNKNDMIQTTIDDMTNEGEGIGHVDGFTLFVKDALPGDIVEARITRPKKTYAYARTERILVPSDDRCGAPCINARRCGGCRLQEMTYGAQLAFKEKKVRDALTRIGGFDGESLPLQHVIGMETPFRYRNKAQYPIGNDARSKSPSPVAGFYAGRTHSIIPVSDCLLAPEEYADILDRFLKWMNKYKIPAYDETTGKGLVRHLLIRKGFSSGQILVCPVVTREKVPHMQELLDLLHCSEQAGSPACSEQINISGAIAGIRSVCLNVNSRRGNVIMGDKTIPLYGDPWIEDQLMGLTFRISPRSFYQVNPAQTEVLYTRALEAAALTGSEVVYDLYCGIGTISLCLAKEARQVYGVEIVPDAVRDARQNAERNGISNAHFYAGAAEEVVPRGYFEENVPCPKADVVVVDPPRKGCAESLLTTILQMNPSRIVYVSCDPATLARDLKYLCAGGTYRLDCVQPVDLFPQTTHVENVARLSRN
ncbi:MAG: 23S rRNA (uracil(1939)-C(5))-methyltransferase RlmD [Lachnospiraceae bacterium]|nr:23S rRNA (uracil(1939)-C(5))-methyltransferase RlmD [Lachnospiraceae bacterium]